jgi:hypothetical protein
MTVKTFLNRTVVLDVVDECSTYGSWNSVRRSCFCCGLVAQVCFSYCCAGMVVDIDV